MELSALLLISGISFIDACQREQAEFGLTLIPHFYSTFGVEELSELSETKLAKIKRR